ncbi:MAG: OmpP1/FadL family transporter [Bradymonadia bacterium]
MKQNLIRIGLLLACGLYPAVALSSGFFVARFGGPHGHPTTDNLTAMYYNPAGLSLGKGTRLYIDGNFARRLVTYTRPQSAVNSVLLDDCRNCGAGTPEDDLAANVGAAELENYLASPFIGVASDFGLENMSFGLSLYAPFGGTSVYDEVDQVGDHIGSVNGTQRWWAIEGTIKSVFITGAAAYRIPDLGLSFGLGVNLVKNQIFTARAKTSDNTDDLVDTSGSGSEIGDGYLLKEGRAIIDVESTELSLGAGIIYEPTQNVWLGVSYQSSPGFGENKLEGRSRLILGSTPEEIEDAVVYQHLPDVWQFGARWRPSEDTELRFSGNYIRWSVLKEHCALGVNENSTDERSNCDSGPLFIAPRNWSDAMGYRLGGSYWFSSAVEVMLGAGYDENAVPDSTLEPALIDMDKVTASLGARFKMLDDSLALAATFTQVVYFTRDINPESQESALVRDATTGTRFGPNAGGKYEQSISLLNLNVEYSF